MTDVAKLWVDTFNRLKTSQIEAQGHSEASVKAGGRATKDYPGKEDSKWWNDFGPGMVDTWIKWRDNSGWGILDMNPGPAIELGVEIELGGIRVQMYIDRVMFKPNPQGLTNDDLIIVDLKTGKFEPKSPMQLALYAAGLEKTYGWRPRWGMYWMSRTGGGDMLDLNEYPTAMFEEMFANFKKARDNSVFIPNLNHCTMCNVVDFCKYQKSEEWSK